MYATKYYEAVQQLPVLGFSDAGILRKNRFNANYRIIIT